MLTSPCKVVVNPASVYGPTTSVGSAPLRTGDSREMFDFLYKTMVWTIEMDICESNLTFTTFIAFFHSCPKTFAQLESFQ